MGRELTFIDLFAGAGGLSEGFIQAGFKPVAHVEMDANACKTLETRVAYHWLKEQGLEEVYYQYLKGEIKRNEFLSTVPAELLKTVINKEISNNTISGIFKQIDGLIGAKKKVDVLIGGPPCQAYSLVGRARDPNGMKGDKRNYLFRYYAQFLEQYKPRYFVFENVLGLLSAGNSKYFDEMRETFQFHGYTTDFKVVNASNYGVLQDRKRVLIIGKLNAPNFIFPLLPEVKHNRIVGTSLFLDLPELQAGEGENICKYTTSYVNAYLKEHRIRNGSAFVSQHVARPHKKQDLEIYEIAIEKLLDQETRLKYTDLPARLRSHKNQHSFLDRFKVINPYGNSHTVVAHISKDGHYYIYPNKSQIRSITVREAARIQSFSDDYFFEGGRTAAYKQIGNAVPPILAKVIANLLIPPTFPNNSRTKNKEHINSY